MNQDEGAARYRAIRFGGMGGTVHLLDTTIPEPVTGGDRPGWVCDLFTFGLDVPQRDLGPVEATATDFGAKLRGDCCATCYRIAWNEILADAVATAEQDREQ